MKNKKNINVCRYVRASVPTNTVTSTLCINTYVYVHQPFQLNRVNRFVLRKLIILSKHKKSFSRRFHLLDLYDFGLLSSFFFLSSSFFFLTLENMPAFFDFSLVFVFCCLVVFTVAQLAFFFKLFYTNLFPFQLRFAKRIYATVLMCVKFCLLSGQR